MLHGSEWCFYKNYKKFCKYYHYPSLKNNLVIKAILLFNFDKEAGARIKVP